MAFEAPTEGRWHGLVLRPDIDPAPFAFLDDLIGKIEGGHAPSEQEFDLVLVFIEFAAFLDSGEFRDKRTITQPHAIESLMRCTSGSRISKPKSLLLLPKVLEYHFKKREKCLVDTWKRHLVTHDVDGRLLSTIDLLWGEHEGAAVGDRG